jgi:hypothetical protein
LISSCILEAAIDPLDSVALFNFCVQFNLRRFGSVCYTTMRKNLKLLQKKNEIVSQLTPEILDALERGTTATQALKSFYGNKGAGSEKDL